MTATVWAVPVPPTAAARQYLRDELAARGNPLPVGYTPPKGRPMSYALLSRPGTNTRLFLSDCMIRIRVFDEDFVRLEQNADLLHRLMLQAVHKRIVVPDVGSVWITAATHDFGPGELDDPDVPLAGMQSAVFWTIGMRPS